MQDHGGKYRSIIEYMRGLERRSWLLNVAPSAWVLRPSEGAFEGNKNKQQAAEKQSSSSSSSSSGFRPPNSKTVKQSKKRQGQNRKNLQKKRTEYLMVNLAGQTTLVAQKDQKKKKTNQNRFLSGSKNTFELCANSSMAFYCNKI